jgi:hypothetical protein
MQLVKPKIKLEEIHKLRFRDFAYPFDYGTKAAIPEIKKSWL